MAVKKIIKGTADLTPKENSSADTGTSKKKKKKTGSDKVVLGGGGLGTPKD